MKKLLCGTLAFGAICLYVGCGSVNSTGTAKPASSYGKYDATKPGTNFHATGMVRARRADKGEEMADFGVIRIPGGEAEVWITFKDGFKRAIRYSKGEWVCISGPQKVAYTRTSADEWKVTVDSYDTYHIPDAIIFGG